MAKTFKELVVWQKGIALVKKIYGLSEHFPKTEVYCLTSQMRRSAISIPSNIAEGFGRQHTKDFKHFLNIALGSTAELETQIVIASELGYIDKKDAGMSQRSVVEIACMLTSFMKKM